MSTPINRETGARYAKFDPFDTRVRQAHFKYQYDWRWEYVELLKVRNYEGAELVRVRNLQRKNGDHVR